MHRSDLALPLSASVVTWVVVVVGALAGGSASRCFQNGQTVNNAASSEDTISNLEAAEPPRRAEVEQGALKHEAVLHPDGGAGLAVASEDLAC